MSAITVRAAVAADWEVIVDYNCRLAAESEDVQLDSALIRPGVKAVLADPNNGRYFLACADERIVGQMMHTWEWSDWRNGEIWWLQSVYVEPDFRRQGVFRLLYNHILKEAESNPKVVGIRLYVENDNEPAQETYRSMGMQHAGYTVMQRIF